MNKEIKAYLHCKTCMGDDHLVVGLNDPFTLVIHCETCDQDVGSFNLTNKIPMRCAVCDEDIGPDHVH